MIIRNNVIVVGTDGIGKTPIAKALSDHYFLPYFKFQNEIAALKNESNPGQHMLWFDYGMTQLSEQTGDSYIFDRGYPCEFVYSGYFNRKTNHDLLEQIDFNHSMLGTIILLLEDSSLSVYNAKDDEYVDKKDIPRIQESYYRFRTWTRCKVVTYDMFDSSQFSTNEERLKFDRPRIINAIEDARFEIRNGWKKK